ncbi:sensor histidine kinase [Rhizohabitans arisaemae]|uniref:sensor histidine kinase n=1 Tax=Rhizohabitans arisaemae TaxID=2720610 RepID=UPI0024B09E86|nr:histidine kinase [Rhizohabitans arisaemae]
MSLARKLLALVLGTLATPLELLWVLLTAGPLAVPAWRGPITAASAELVRWHAPRLALLDVRPGPITGAQAHLYLTARCAVGVLSILVLSLLLYGLGSVYWLFGGWAIGERPDNIEPHPWNLAYILLGGGVLFFLNLSGIAALIVLERHLALRLLTPDPAEALRRRIAELAESRAGIVTAVDAERRRIERDLHDGLQQRLVALAMLIGRTRRGRSPEQLDALLAQAHDEARQAVADLREVAWRVYPTGLDTLGLAETLATLAERSAVPVRIRCEVAGHTVGAVETAAYFVVCEAVTNAAKHAEATRITVDVVRNGDTLVVEVTDDGRGGADPSGGGLSGLARRAAALDGRLLVGSPQGGPTVIRAELPCA